MRGIYFSIAAFTIFITSCHVKQEKLVRIAGEAQGTTWHISYLSDQESNYKKAIDSILVDLDQSLSTYVPTSVISRINRNDPDVIADQHFKDVFTKSVEVSEKTNGSFDVTVGPLINAWGFGLTKKASVDSAMIDSLLEYVGFKMVHLDGDKVVKARPEIQIDFNAIAQGYSVDVIAAFLKSKGVKNYLVELGGELRARGTKSNERWTVGIDQPVSSLSAERELEAIIELNDRALATSGNYRKFYEENGRKYSHIIDPVTGYPAQQSLLSATVLASDAMTADAYATAFMVIGADQSKQFLKANKDLNLEVFFIYDEGGTSKTYISEGLTKWIRKVD